jgi:hypothetical protein
MSGVIQTPLLTHSTNPRSLNFVGLDNPDHNSGVNMGVLYGAGKAQAEIAACNATQICTKIQPLIGPHFKLGP